MIHNASECRDCQRERGGVHRERERLRAAYPDAARDPRFDVMLDIAIDAGWENYTSSPEDFLQAILTLVGLPSQPV